MNDPSFDVAFTLRVAYADKQKAKDLKCFWNPETKKWKKTFTNHGFYRDGDFCDYYNNVKHFMKRCASENIVIESIWGLDELEEYHTKFKL